MNRLDVWIVTGHSGSGRSTALRELEDAGFYCVDNLPIVLTESLIDLLERDATTTRLALGVDVRERSFLSEGPALVERLKHRGVHARVLFLEAKESTLVRRYAETRRAHPLDDGCGLVEAIGRERSRMAPLREIANETIDTSTLTPHALRALIRSMVAADERQRLHLALVSFGFKYGVPFESNIVFDVRFLPNPYFDPDLRPLSGKDPRVRDVVFSDGDAAACIEETSRLLDFLLPRYEREGKRYLTVAIGCTGGQHRSVAVVEELAAVLRASGRDVSIRHRDVEENRS